MKPFAVVLALVSAAAAVSNIAPARQLAGVSEELLTASNIYLAEDGMSAKTACLRVEGLLDSLHTLKDKCNKYMFILQNYVSFYQSRTDEKLIRENAQKANPFATVANGFSVNGLGSGAAPGSLQGPMRALSEVDAQFLQPQLISGGNIESHEANFDFLDPENDGKI